MFCLGKAHLREALLQHEEALRVNRMCRELRKKDALHDVLRLAPGSAHPEAVTSLHSLALLQPLVGLVHLGPCTDLARG